MPSMVGVHLSGVIRGILPLGCTRISHQRDTPFLFYSYSEKKEVGIFRIQSHTTAQVQVRRGIEQCGPKI